jgi:hypothetical protein
MNKLLNSEELEQTISVAVQNVFTQPMCRSAKLARWAQLCREAGFALRLGNNLEYADKFALEHTPATYNWPSALSIAVYDPVFNEQGLGEDASIWSLMQFFEINTSELHQFSCDCGGHINNLEQARRIELLM